MTKEYQGKTWLNKEVQETIEEIEGIIESSSDDESGQDLSSDWRKAGERLVINTSIVSVLANIVDIPKSQVVSMLAEKTEGLEAKDELLVAVKVGINLAGDEFQRALIDELKSHLSEKE